MARSIGSIHISDNSVTSINDAIQQLMFLLDELRGEHDTTQIFIGPHDHGGVQDGQDGGVINSPAQNIDHDDLINVTSDQHHNKLHQALHNEGGADELKLDDTGNPEDNTDNDATTGHHGLLPKLSGNSNEFLNGQGTFAGVTAAEANDVANVEANLTEQIWEKVFSNDGSITITELASGEAIDLHVVSAGGTGESFHPFLLMGA